MPENVKLALPVPRDPADYQISAPTGKPGDGKGRYNSGHFMYRFNRRSNPDCEWHIVEQAIRTGKILNTSSENRKIFEVELPGTVDDEPVENIRWRIIAEFDPKAFTGENHKHTLLTIYAPDYHNRD